jgi:hypothetical protein
MFFMARCLQCNWTAQTTEYQERSTQVGDHRVKSGHTVHMWLEAKEGGKHE